MTNELCECGHEKDLHRYNTYTCSNECSGKEGPQIINGMNLVKVCPCKKFIPNQSKTSDMKTEDTQTPSENISSVELTGTSEGDFCLSKNRQDTNKGTDFIRYAYKEEDVKEFVQKLKQKTFGFFGDELAYDAFIKEIDKLAGEKLI